jgi:hypothetical protein
LTPQLCKAFLKKLIDSFGASYGSQLPHMDFSFCLGKTVKFWLITPTHSTPYSFVAPFDGSVMAVQGGVMLQ